MNTAAIRSNRSAHAEKWLAYSSMAGAFLAVAPDADAQIQYTDVIPDHVIINGTYHIDFDSDGNADLHLGQIATVSGGSTTASAYAGAGGPGAEVIGLFVPGPYAPILSPTVLGPGASIGPASPNWHGLSTSSGALLGFNQGGLFGNWPAQTGFFGLKFVAGDATVHFAWVELSVGNMVQSVTVKGYAWQTAPDTLINAGATGSGIGMDEHAAPLSFTLSPNPAIDQAIVRLPQQGSGAVQVSVINSLGQVLSTQQAGEGTRELVLDVSALDAGCYFVQVRAGDRVVHQKLTKVQ